MSLMGKWTKKLKDDATDISSIYPQLNKPNFIIFSTRLDGYSILHISVAIPFPHVHYMTSSKTSISRKQKFYS